MSAVLFFADCCFEMVCGFSCYKKNRKIFQKTIDKEKKRVYNDFIKIKFSKIKFIKVK